MRDDSKNEGGMRDDKHLKVGCGIKKLVATFRWVGCRIVFNVYGGMLVALRNKLSDRAGWRD